MGKAEHAFLQSRTSINIFVLFMVKGFRSPKSATLAIELFGAESNPDPAGSGETFNSFLKKLN